MGEPTVGLGLSLGYDASGPAPYTYANLGYLTEVNPPALFTEFVEFVRHDGPGYRERIPHLQDTEEMTFTVAYDSNDTDHSALVAAFVAKTEVAWRVTYTDTGAEVWTFMGWIARIEAGAPVDDLNTRVFTVRPTGVVTIA